MIEEHIDVGAPREKTFESWANLRLLQRFTKGEEAKEERGGKVTVRSKIGPSSRSWQTKVVVREPGRRIAWKSVGGPTNCGVVSFHSLDERLTRVMVEMEYHPKGFVEAVGNFFRMQRRRVRKDLRLFKNYVEVEAAKPGSTGSTAPSKAGGRRAGPSRRRTASAARSRSTTRSRARSSSSGRRTASSTSRKSTR